MAGEERQPTHECGSHHSRIGADEYGVDGDRYPGGYRTASNT
jgi:hypothetical protein